MPGLVGDTVFDRCGIAALSDLTDRLSTNTFRELERLQEQFLAVWDPMRDSDYKWPRDPLHWWSRVWEYPYAYHHLRAYREAFAGATLAKVADVGSGVTFFPNAVARLGYDVVCTDIDPVCERDLARVAEQLHSEPGAISFG